MKKEIKSAIDRNQSALHSLIALRRAQNKIEKEELEVIRKSPLTLTQFGVLEALYNLGDLRIQTLIEKLLSTSGNMTLVIKNMVRDGYVTKVCDPTDGRASLIQLTPKGKKTIEAILEEHYHNIGRIFSVLSKKEQDQLVQIMKKFKNL
ncbi:MarR family winged helix-turn-helix transcriptional regulator [Streptococcus sp. DD13]|uniref:MarR family winged helix-turn-helix transcriptional regulator n=1 Tax=Streptococcus sp. DD13 TaxID=1777881 RepID=UPI00079C1A46|nr:MarR family transcriptional regulator [Streptococcus sp. DD13]KXT78541.1 Transcriptional regulator, MarR family [Streptococcus sp. DD13]